MAYAGSCVPEMAIARVCVVAPPRSGNSLYKHKTSEGDSGSLAGLAHRHMVR